MWSNRYLEIPFKAGGRDWSGCDCYGLVRLVLRERFGKDIPPFLDYETLDPSEISPVADSIRTGVPATEVETPREGDVAVIALRGLEVHCGVFVDEKRVLHTDSTTGPVIEDVSRPRLHGRIRGIYRVD